MSWISCFTGKALQLKRWAYAHQSKVAAIKLKEYTTKIRKFSLSLDVNGSYTSHPSHTQSHHVPHFYIPKHVLKTSIRMKCDP